MENYRSTIWATVVFIWLVITLIGAIQIGYTGL